MLRSFSPRLKNPLPADLLIRLCEQIPCAYVVLWCTRDVAGYRTAHVTAIGFGILTTVEMTVAALGGDCLRQLGPAVNFLSAFTFGVCGATWFGFFGRDESAEEQPVTEAAKANLSSGKDESKNPALLGK